MEFYKAPTKPTPDATGAVGATATCYADENAEVNDNVAIQGPMLYPLGNNIYLTVKAFKGRVKLHIREYYTPKNIKTTRVLPGRKGICLDSEQFQRLLRNQDKVKADFKTVTELVAQKRQALEQLPSPNGDSWNPDPPKGAATSASSKLYPLKRQRRPDYSDSQFDWSTYTQVPRV